MSLQSVCHLLPYFRNSADLFAACAHEPWAVFLDSGYPSSQQGRYDIFSANPICTFETSAGLTTISSASQMLISSENPFDLLKSELKRYGEMFSASSIPLDLPFNGGAIGYFSYDLARYIERLPSIATDAEGTADMAVGIYDWAVIVDHHAAQSYLICYDLEKTPQLITQFSEIRREGSAEPFSLNSAIQANFSQTTYKHAFQKIKQYLKEGDCYQVNLTQRFSANCQGDTWAVYRILREVNAAPFSAYLHFPFVRVLSSSPERFLKLTGQHVETKPIKGTRPRKVDERENQAQMQSLQNSPKDRAENVMIVDLLRNDISKVCETGSVRVPKLFEIESYSTVHHLVSTVTGQLAQEKHALDLLKECFPGGSITGAPKIRAMQIIDEIEPHQRGVYCGAIGYIGFNGNMDTNIAIRTLVESDNTIRFWAGGGIVNDSVMEDEYQESFDKAAALFDVLKRFQS